MQKLINQVLANGIEDFFINYFYSIVWLVISLYLMYWICNDAKKRDETTAWVLAPLVLGVFGFIVYLIFRKQKTFEKFKEERRYR